VSKLTADELTALTIPAHNEISGGNIYNHKASGREYMTLAIVLIEDGLVPAVAYTATDQNEPITWVRPFAEFKEKFEKVAL